MGSGSYSIMDRTDRALEKGYFHKSMNEIFTRKQVNNAMNPYGLGIRESRDSDEHPNSYAIVLALDVTGSMGSIPHYLVKSGLPTFMEKMIKSGVPDPQVLFLGIGDHECDTAPLQVGQFESSDELLDHWLTELYIEGHGGGNDGESYLLAWLTAGMHTSIDCFEKRNDKGILFTVGDEPCLRSLPATAHKDIMGAKQPSQFSREELLDRAREKYHVFHLHLRQGANGYREEVMDGWKQLIGPDHLIIVEQKEDVADILARTVVDQLMKSNALQPTKVAQDEKVFRIEPNKAEGEML